MPLKAIVRGYSYRIISNTWVNRKTGIVHIIFKAALKKIFPATHNLG